MKLTLFKIDKITEKEGIKTFEIPTGGIQFEFRNHEIISSEPTIFQIDAIGGYMDIVKYVRFDIYTDDSLIPTGKVKSYSLISVIAHEMVQETIEKEVARLCKVIPLKRRISERELFESEYESRFIKMLEGK